MKNILIVVDAQNDFITGSLGSAEAVSVVSNIVEKIKNHDGEVVYTFDTHFDHSYLNTQEGKKLPILHCIHGTDGWKINQDILHASDEKDCYYITKYAFGSKDLPEWVRKIAGRHKTKIELIGYVLDICVISNALLLKAFYPEVDITVDISCCCASSKENKEAAIKILKSCQIDIINE